MKTAALIPIKMNNERLPQKNTKTFSDGTPLIKLILETVSSVSEIDEIYVYCSNPAIKEYFPNKRIRYLRRDTSLDLPTTKINEVLKAFANDVEADIYVLAHATAPFIKAERFISGIKAVSSGEYDSALAVTALRDFFWKDGKPFNYDPAAIPRTQDLEPIYAETSGMYVFTANLIKHENRRVGHFPYLVEISETEACDIDTPEDFEIADAIYTYCQNAQSASCTTGGGI